MPLKRGRGDTTPGRGRNFVKTRGAVNLIPEKYWRQIKRYQTDEDVAADYTFPEDLTGDQAFVRLAEKTTTEARLTIIEEILNTDLTPLLGHKLDQWGSLSIYEDVVDDGTAIDEGYGVLTSTVSPLGNGKSVRITVRYPTDLATRELHVKKIGKPTVVPEKFQQFLRDLTTIKEVDIDSYTFPVLLTGDQSEIKYEEESQDRAKVETTEQFVAENAVLTSYKKTAEGQIETVVQTLLDGPQTILPTALTEEASVEAIGDDKTIKTVGTVPIVFTNAKFSRRRPDAAPEEFKALLETSTQSVIAAGTAADPVLGVGELERTSDQIDVFKVRTSVTARDILGLPATLIDTATTDDKQVETITKTLELSGVSTAIPTALQSVRVRQLGDGTELEEVRAVPGLFTRQTFAKRIDDPVPVRFRVAIPTITEIFDSIGTAVMPTLIAGQLSEEQVQRDEFVKRTTKTLRDAPTLPVVLTSYKLTQLGQVETVVETYDTGLQTLSGLSALTEEADVQNLGDGTSLKKVGSVASLFTNAKFERSRPDAAPPEFRALLESTTQSVISAGTAADPVLGVGELSRTSDQVDAFKVRSTVTARDVASLPQTLTDTDTNRNKQIVTIGKTLELSGVSTAVPSALQTVSVKQLGDGTEVEEVSSVSSVFPAASYATAIPDPIPDRFKVAVPVTVTEITAAGNAAPPVLGTGDIEITDNDEDVFTHRLRTKSRSTISLPVSLTTYRLSRDGQVETIIETLATGLQTITGSALTTEAEVENLGNNTSLKRVATVPSVFDAPEYSTEIPDNVPPRFRVAVPTETFEETIAGIAAAPTLGAGDLRISERQIDEFKKRVSTTSRSSVTLPVSLVSKDTNDAKQVVTVTETLKAAGGDAAPSGLQDVKVQNLGDGTVFQEVRSVAGLFGRKSSSREIADLVPIEFRGIVETFETTEDVLGTIVDPPVLGVGDLSKTETQLDAFTKRVRIRTRGGVTLPITLVGGQKLVEKFGVQLVADEVITLAATGTQTIPTGPNVIEAAVKEIGAGMEVLTSLVTASPTWPLLTSRLFDEDMRVMYEESRQIVDPATVVAPPTSTTLEEIKAIDGLHSWRVRTTKVPTAISEATAVESDIMRPYTFPGRWNSTLAATTSAGLEELAFTAPHSTLVRVTQKQWWVESPVKPVFLFDEIQTTTAYFVRAGGNTVGRFDQVLSDSYVLFNAFLVPASKPSWSEFMGITYQPASITATNGTSTISGINTHFFSTFVPGVTYIWPGGYPGKVQTILSDTALFLTAAYAGPTTTSNFGNPVQGQGWIGTRRVIGASVEPDRLPNLWRITTQSVIMR